MSGLAALYSQNAGPRLSKKAFRSVPQAPERILDAPDMLDDYYLNLLDWGSNNVVRGPGIAARMRSMQCDQPCMHIAPQALRVALWSCFRPAVPSAACRWLWRWARRCTCGMRAAAASSS